MEVNTFYSYSHFIVAFVSFAISLLVFVKDKKNKLNIILAVNLIMLGLWAFFYAIWMLEDSDAEKALFWARMLNIWPLFIPAFLLHWILLFLKKIKENSILVYLIYFYSIITSFFSFSDHFIYGVAPVGGFPFWPQINWLYILFLLFSWFPVITYSIFLLFKEIINPVKATRMQSVYLLIGVIFTASGGSVNFLLMFGVDIVPPIFSVLSIAFPILFSYAIIKHRLFDIKFVLRRSTVYLLSISLVTSLVLFFSYITEGYFSNSNLLYLVDTFVIVAMMVSFVPIKNFFYRLSNKYFFTSLYDPQEVLEQVSLLLRENIEKQKIYDSLMLILDKAFYFNQFGILLFNKRKQKYFVDFAHRFKVNKKAEFKAVDRIEQDFVINSEPIVTEELTRFYKNYEEDEKCQVDKFLKLLIQYNVAVLCPLRSKGETVGLMVLGSKESKESYNIEDIRLLKNISAQLAITLENAQLYDQLKNFNQQLERRVNLRTRQLNKANKDLAKLNDQLHKTNIKLRKLDKAKTEFLSIASHQLRTPLSSTKGFLSLLLDGTYGKIPSKSRQALEKICISNERLITLVEDLLNISRIEAGRLTFDFRKESLEKVTQEVLDTMTLVAKNAGLTLEKKFPAKSPLIYFDRAKMREVISNFIDNAIKYTKEGQVTVIIEELKTKIRLIVQDTGMGIGKDDLEGIFEKFQRGDRGGRVNSNGVGLGLYVCRKIIDAHKGRVWAESDGIGKGSRFIIELDKNWKPKKVGA